MAKSKLESLKDMVAKMFEGAEDKVSIENMAKLNNGIEACQEEQQDLVQQNAELIGSYKELIRHTSFNENTNKVKGQDDVNGFTLPSFEDALNNFIDKGEF